MLDTHTLNLAQLTMQQVRLAASFTQQLYSSIQINVPQLQQNNVNLFLPRVSFLFTKSRNSFLDYSIFTNLALVIHTRVFFTSNLVLHQTDIETYFKDKSVVSIVTPLSSTGDMVFWNKVFDYLTKYTSKLFSLKLFLTTIMGLDIFLYPPIKLYRSLVLDPSFWVVKVIKLT